MAFVINTNIMSINAQRNLYKTQGPLQNAMKRLSSGLRINSSADDAAGLAIATRMTSQIRGLTVAERNANDGLSMVQTAEGSMSEVINNLQRIRELGVQAMSGQYSVTDVANMQKEVNVLVEEIGRIAEQTKFNGIRLLDGHFHTKLQTSFAASDSQVQVTLGSMNTDALGGPIFTKTDKSGPMMFLKDIHTATTVGVNGRGDGTFVSGSGFGFPPNYSFTASSTIAYSGAASFQIADSTSLTGFISQASNAIAIVDSALNFVTSSMADMGAKANQLEANIRNLENVLETTQASRSRIMDADFAAETANLTKAMILQQSGISVLAQANSSPQNVLALLK
ncbi:flagellin N-terminal helical domain-containing protein [Candidatus Magnetomonas plexicatena]|uniref:flagellin N-terminal helical domain-containing protein n=1 Tax=Candidatus Magnetomonas plexicatena TaxID=2552947 RepID=UPI0040328C08